MNPLLDFSKCAESAWKYVDSFEHLNNADDELLSCLDFLEDVRVFSSGGNALIVHNLPQSLTRFQFFVLSRRMADRAPITRSMQLLLSNCDHADFVIRESIANAISTALSRQDSSLETIGPLWAEITATADVLCDDLHWYVRHSAQTAAFFTREFRKEHPEIE